MQMPEPDTDPLNWSTNSDQFGLSKSSSSMARALNELVNKIVEDDWNQGKSEVGVPANNSFNK